MSKQVRPADKKAAAKKPTYTGAPGEPTPMTLKKKYRAR